ncbi:hypothetical protein SLS60_006367 [Paraconiothyrium brasiliense]|uniref:C2H2-type domain-containing protein n=1 Tax=Paraconiothyrium brasiliense TaxID=300254 RepID=A0ABR3RBZ1_9PLEO
MSAPTARSSAKGRQSIHVPPDVLAARREKTTESMLAQLHEPPPVTNPSPFRGFGLYTDVEVEVPHKDPRLAHKHYTVKKFLPLGGPQHVHNKRRKRDDLPDEVLRVYNELEAIMLREEDAEKRGTRQDPLKRFKPMECLEILVPPPSPPPPLPKPVETVLQTTTTILEANDGTRKDTQKETGEEVRNYINHETRVNSHRDTEPIPPVENRPPISLPARAQIPNETESKSSDDAEDISTADSRPKIPFAPNQESVVVSPRESLVAPSVVQIKSGRPHMPPPTMQLYCRNCKLYLNSIKELVAHFMKCHIEELDSVYFACCPPPDRHYYKATCNSFMHMQDVHGWDHLTPFPCHECDAKFFDIRDVREHFESTHQTSKTQRSAGFAPSRTMSHPGLRARTPPRRSPSTDGADWHPAFRPPTSPRRDRPPPTFSGPHWHTAARSRSPPRRSTSNDRASWHPASKNPSEPPSRNPSFTSTPGSLPPFKEDPRNSFSRLDGSAIPSTNLNIRCLVCGVDLKTIPSLTSHLFSQHADGMPKLWWECCHMNGMPVGATLKHLKEVHGWRDGLPCPGERCTRTFELLPEWHGHVRSHLHELSKGSKVSNKASDDRARSASVGSRSSAMDLSDG